MEVTVFLVSFFMATVSTRCGYQNFAGDSLEYHFFMSSFREAVECNINNLHGRLVWLLNYE